MKKQLITLIAMLLPMLASAYDAQIDGVYYNFDKNAKTATVTYQKHEGINFVSDYSGNVTIPNEVTYNSQEYTVTSIDYYAFSGCSNLTSVTIPNSVITISPYAFEGCSSIMSLTIPTSVTSIGSGVFSRCSSLTSVIIPNSVISIGIFAFDGCSSLTSVIIPNSITSINNGVFQGCSGLTSIVIPNSVTSIGNYAFQRCSGLTSVTIPNSVTSIGNIAFGSCGSLTSVIIPNSVTSIGERAFEWCIRLTDVSLPDNLTSIKIQTFQSCSKLTGITIPATVEYIYAEAFAGCSALKEVIALPQDPPLLYDNSFSNYDITLKVPEASKDAYMTTSPWSDFTTFKTLTGEDLEKKKCATPIISVVNGIVHFDCETEDVEFHYGFTNPIFANSVGNNMEIPSSYNLTVYATRTGYENSEVATLEIPVGPGNQGNNSILGDLNGDNVVNAADMVALVNIIMGEGSGSDNPPVSGDDSEVTSKISAYYAGGAINKINNTIQNGSQLLWGFKNGSSVSVTLIGAVLINGVTGTESNNLLSEPLEVAAGETKGLTTTIGVLGIQEPKIRFTYKYNQKEYSVEAAYKDFDGI